MNIKKFSTMKQICSLLEKEDVIVKLQGYTPTNQRDWSTAAEIVEVASELSGVVEIRSGSKKATMSISTFDAIARSDADLSLGKVLPNGAIQLSSEGRHKLLAVLEVFAEKELPPKTGGGLDVYYGVDGQMYSEEGVRLAPNEHLYDEVDGHDVGVVSDTVDARRSGEFYDSSLESLLKGIPRGLRHIRLQYQGQARISKDSFDVRMVNSFLYLSFDPETGEVRIGATSGESDLFGVIRYVQGRFVMDDLTAVLARVKNLALLELKKTDGVKHELIDIYLESTGYDGHKDPISGFLSALDGFKTLKDIAGESSGLQKLYHDIVDLDDGELAFRLQKSVVDNAVRPELQLLADLKISKADPLLKGELEKHKGEAKTPAEADKLIERAWHTLANMLSSKGARITSAMDLNGNVQKVIVNSDERIIDVTTYQPTQGKVATVCFSNALKQAMIFQTEPDFRP